MSTLITGGSGLLGKHLQEIFPEAIYVSTKDFDLTSQKEVAILMSQERPDRVIHLAAKVGGILDNQKLPCDYFEENTLINTNILKAARRAGVKRFTGVLSTCIYPDHLPGLLTYPLKEEMLHEGPPAASNFGYGIAKRALATHIDMCNAQYGTKYNYVIPCNLYGFYDNFNSERSHYVAALIKKIYNASLQNPSLELFGTGRPLRQFMYAGDLARVLMEMNKRDITDSFNVATPEVYSILEIAEIACKAVNKNLKINLNPDLPDGQFRKDVSIDKFLTHFPDFEFTKLSEGIKLTYDYYTATEQK
jgi:GDP-L-fucose synthase